MAQRWVTEEELQQLTQTFEQGGSPQGSNPLEDFFNQLPPELQEKIQMLPPEKQQEVLMQLMERYSQQQQQFAEGGRSEGIPVEAERNETLTTQDGSIPNTEGGYLERKSFNPISGQATYEIPDNEHNQTHPEGGVNMVLKEGDVVNSDKTKIPTDFKVYGKNFKGKTFKEASDFLSKKEEGIQKQLTELQKEGKADRVSENSVSIMLAKAAINRNELNELQEQVLESKKQKEHTESLERNIKQFGGLVKNATKAEEVYNKTLDRFLNGYTTERPVLKAEKGLSASISKMQSFTDKIAANPNMSTQDVMAAFKQSGLYNQPSESTAIYKPNFAPIKNGSSVVGDFKSQIAQRETGGYKNPYIAVSGISEKDAATHSFNELKSKAASSAIGKYQFIWSIHKNAIKKLTGVSDPDAFRNNPQAQEKYMDWHISHQLTPIATKLKQKYDLPYSINQIMSMIHLEGEAGLEKKIKSGTMNNSTLANNSFKNPSPLGYASHFVQGGEVEKVSNISYESPYQSYSDPHPKALESFKKDYYDSLEGESSIYVDGKYYVYDGANPVKTKTGKINTPLDKEDEEYKKALELLDNEATLYAKNTYFENIFSKMGEVPSGYKVPEDYKDFLSKLRQESKGNVNYYDDTDEYSRYVGPLGNDPKAEDVNKYINKFGGYKPSSVRDFLFENRNNFKHGGYIADGVSANPKASLQDIMSSYKSSGLGAMNTSTLANNSFKNPSPLDYASNFKEAGGKIYANPGVTLPILGHKAINQFENTKGNPFGQSMQMGDNYSQSAEPKIIKFITDNIGEDTWNKMPPELQTQVYSFAFNSKQDDRVFKGLATAINPNEVYKGQKDLDVARQNLDPARAIQMIKGADFSDPTIYNNYIDQILPQQYQSIADNYSGGFDKGQAIYNATWKNRAKDIDKIYKDLVQLSQQNSTPILKKQDEKLKNPFKFSTWQGDKSGLNKADYTADDLSYIAKTYFPNQQFKSNKELQEAIVSYLDENFGGYQNYVKPITPFASKKTPLPGALYDGKFGDDWSAAIKLLKENSPVSVPVPEFKLDPYITKETKDVPIDNRNDLNRAKLRIPSNNEGVIDETNSKQTPTTEANKTSWKDKLKYGMRESLPYLDNLRLLMEGRIMPTLQQRPYDNPYDNMRTDYNIQSNLNENQRALLTTIADSTGNPSVRNARLAQLAANAANMNNQLYSQKYNQELAMENQKTLGQGNYRNQFNLDNMNLQKRYEQEVLQTIENQRQQKHMASNKMMNDYLRKQEQDQARDLALLETNYDWNPYSGKFEFNPEKAKRNMAYKKATFSSSSNKNSGIITIGGNKYIKKKNGNLECLDCDDKSQTTKYGGKIKRK